MAAGPLQRYLLLIAEYNKEMDINMFTIWCDVLW